MNTDGSGRGTVGNIACGGVMRDWKGEVKGGFLFNVGNGGSFLAELWGILMGLRWSWDYGARCLVLETDCLEAVQILEDLSESDFANSSIIREIKSMLNRDWDVQITWCNREANKLADLLARQAMEIGAGVVNFREVPDFIAAEVEQERLLFS